MPAYRTLCLAAGLLAMAANHGAADDTTALFNGKDLSGWTYHLARPDVPMEDVWSVKDGVLVCKGKPAGYLLTKKNDYQNYVLTLEWRWPKQGGNNGVLVHVTKPGELGVWPKSLEVQLESGNAGDFWTIGTTIEIEHPEGRIEERRHINLSDGDEKPLGKWNKMEIACRGDEVTVKVNGKLVNHATHLSQTKGAIALQSEGTPIEFRKIKLKQLNN
jgi:3-keto-disaccharide hydrolase